MTRQAVDPLVIRPREVADPGTLDLDDARAQVRELTCRERCCHRLLKRHDRHTLQRLHQKERGRPRTCSPM